MTDAEQKRVGADEPDAMANLRRNPTSPLGGLVSMRMVRLFTLMRRSTMVTYRRDFNLTEIEWRIMSTVSDETRLSLNGMADRLVQDRGQLSRSVKAMVERGLLTRSRKPGGPEIEIGPATAGKELRARMTERAQERDAFLTDGIPEEDLDVVRRVIEHMVARAEKLLELALTETEVVD
ncbi:MAG: MarR family winged helix-turn-helix transcriptional regulator [Alteraurantiacibacter sp.]